MRFFQFIKQAFSSAPGDDSSAYPKGKATANGKESEFNRLLPYGLSALEPEGSYVFVMNAQGQEGLKFGIPSAMQTRKKNLEQGEVAVYNSTTSTWLYLKADGTIEINCDTTITGDLAVNGDLNVDGSAVIGADLDVGQDVAVSGDVDVTGEVTCATAVIGGIDFASHVHTQAADAGGDAENPTGVPK